MYIEPHVLVGIIFSVITFGLAMCAPGAPSNSNIGRVLFGMVWVVAMIIMWLVILK